MFQCYRPDSHPSLQMITDLADMMIDRLRLYAEKNQTLPDRVFVYRDGVSEVR